MATPVDLSLTGILSFLRVRCRPWWQGGRQAFASCPCAGLGLLACAGILLGEEVHQCFRRGPAATWPGGPWAGSAVFFFVASLFAWKPRGIFCLAAVVSAFATLHLFRLNDPASTGLAGELAAPSSGERVAVPPMGDAEESFSLGEAGPARTLRARGIILDEPRASSPTGGSVQAAGGKNWRFTLGLSFVEIHGRAWRCRAHVAVFWRNGPGTLAAGQRLELNGTGRGIAAARNPGEFDYAKFLRRRDIRTEIRCSGIADVHLLPPVGWSWSSVLPGTARRFQAWTQARLTAGLQDDPAAAAVVSALLLGLRSDLGLGDLEGVFQRTGTLHFFAIDGLKLGVLTALLTGALALPGLRRQWSKTLVLPLLTGYVLATGPGPASLRAIILVAVLAGGEWIGRRPRPLNSLGAAAVAILAFDTNQLFQLGFQMTFLVVLAILCVAVPLRRQLLRVGCPDPFLPPALYSPGRQVVEWLRGHVLGLVCVSVAAGLGSLPLMLWEFHVVSPVSLVANVVMFPLVFASIALGVLSLVVSLVWQRWAVWLNNTNWLMAKAILATAQCSDAVPGGSFYAARPEWHRERSVAEITILDLPYGARSAYLHTAGRTGTGGSSNFLLDTGKETDFRRVVVPFLHSHGLNRIDGLILTQPDASHLAAAPLALVQLDPRCVYDSAAAGQASSFQRNLNHLLLEEKGKRAVVHWRCGDALELAGSARLRVLYPPTEEGASGRTAADKGLVLQMRAAGWRVLFLGDSSPAAIQFVSRHEASGELRSDVVVCGAPLDDVAEVPGFWSTVAPRLIVQEAPKDNHEAGSSWRSVAAPAAVIVLSTVRGGAVTLRAGPHHLAASTFLDGCEIRLER